MAVAVPLVSILTANGTYPFAGLVANDLHWQGQKNNLAKNVVQGETIPFIKTDINGRLGNLVLATVGFSRRKIDKVELFLNRYRNRFQASVTGGGNIYFQIPLDSNVSHRMAQQLRPALAM